jgi:uncharacterized protein YdhG (YjbR/CyaY superfamily)
LTPRDTLRALIASADPRIVESVKWNAPSFAITEHFATLSARPQLLHVVLHTGAKKRARPTAIVVDDPAALLRWPATDRAVAEFRDAADLAARGPALVPILRAWIAQTQGRGGSTAMPVTTRAVARKVAKGTSKTVAKQAGRKATKAPSAAEARATASRISAYIAALPVPVAKEVRKMRIAVRAAAPAAVEHFSYGIPGLRLDGMALVFYAGWKAHVSLYPIGESIVKAHAKALAGCSFSKGTVRFPLTAPPSAVLVRKLVKARIAQVRAGARVG